MNNKTLNFLLKKPQLKDKSIFCPPQIIGRKSSFFFANKFFFPLKGTICFPVTTQRKPRAIKLHQLAQCDAVYFIVKKTISKINKKGPELHFPPKFSNILSQLISLGMGWGIYGPPLYLICSLTLRIIRLHCGNISIDS